MGVSASSKIGLEVTIFIMPFDQGHCTASLNDSVSLRDKMSSKGATGPTTRLILSPIQVESGQASEPALPCYHGINSFIHLIEVAEP